MTVPNRFSRKLPLMFAEDISDILVYEILPKKETNDGAGWMWGVRRWHMTSSPCLKYGLNQKEEANNDFSFISLKCKSRDLSSDHIHALKSSIDGKASISLDFLKQGISRLAMVMKVVCT